MGHRQDGDEFIMYASPKSAVCAADSPCCFFTSMVLTCRSDLSGFADRAGAYRKYRIAKCG